MHDLLSPNSSSINGRPTNHQSLNYTQSAGWAEFPRRGLRGPRKPVWMSRSCTLTGRNDEVFGEREVKDHEGVEIDDNNFDGDDSLDDETFQNSSYDEEEKHETLYEAGVELLLSDDHREEYETSDQLDIIRVDEVEGSELVDENDEGLDALDEDEEIEDEKEDGSIFLELPETNDRELDNRDAPSDGATVVTEIFSRFVEALLAKNSKIEMQTLLNAIQDCYGETSH